MDPKNMNFDDGIPGVPQEQKGRVTEETDLTQGEKEAMDLPKLLEGAGYPASKQNLIDYAEDSGSGPEILDMLEQLPDSTYNSPADVSQALGENAQV